METFEVIIKSEKENSYRRIILLLAALHTLFFIYLLFDPIFWKKGVAGLIIIALYSGYKLLISKTSYQRYSFGSGFFLPFAFVFTIPVVSILDMILFLLSSAALQKTSFNFTSTSIERKNFPPKRYNWDQVSNVILKDNLLTIDFKNNKLFQSEIENITIDEIAFNTFAKAQMNK